MNNIDLYIKEYLNILSEDNSKGDSKVDSEKILKIVDKEGYYDITYEIDVSNEDEKKKLDEEISENLGLGTSLRDSLSILSIIMKKFHKDTDEDSNSIEDDKTKTDDSIYDQGDKAEFEDDEEDEDDENTVKPV